MALKRALRSLTMETAMATAPPRDACWTAADLVARFGPIPLYRIRMTPLPGTATEQDVVAIETLENRLFELVEGVLVEKVMGTNESAIAVRLIAALYAFVTPRKLGVVLGADGMLRFAPGLVRIPDVSFISSQKLDGGKLPSEAIAGIVPDIAVEVLSTGNTDDEMTRKLDEYLAYGTQIVWYIDPKAKQVQVFQGMGDSRTLKLGDALDGHHVLPGFSMAVAELFG